MINESISVIFPAYNEEKNIGEAVLSADSVLSRITSDYEIIIVNDGSIDRTERVIQKLTESNRQIRTSNHLKNKGYGAALKSGLKSARKDLIFFTDSDLQFDISELNKLLKWIHKYDIITGYRVKRRDNLMRTLNALGWGMLIRALFGLRIRDIDCAFKVFRKKVIQDLDIDSVGAFVNSEILIRARKMGCRIKQIPVSHYPRTHGEQTGAKPKIIVRAFIDLIRLYRELK